MFRKWLTGSPKANKFSRENCDTLCRSIHAYESSGGDPTPARVEAVIEAIRSLSEVVLWGDKFDPDTFFTFLESNMMATFHKLCADHRVMNAIKVQVIQTITILLQNLTNEASIYSVLSNNVINKIISNDFDFESEEIISNYISMLKTMSLRLNPQTIQLFYHKEQYAFPLYSEAIKFFKHDDTLVRTSVRALALNVFKVTDPAVRQYIEENGDKFFNQFSWYIRDQFLGLYEAVRRYDAALFLGHSDEQLLPLGQMNTYCQDLIDDFLFVNDLIELPSDRLVAVLEQHLKTVTLQFLLEPVSDAVHLFLLGQWANASTNHTFMNDVLGSLLPTVLHALHTSDDPRILHTCLLALHNTRRNRSVNWETLAEATGCDLRAKPKGSRGLVQESGGPTAVSAQQPPLSPTEGGGQKGSIRPGDPLSICFPVLPKPPEPLRVLSGLLHTLARAATFPALVRTNTLVLTSLLLQEVLGCEGGHVPLDEADMAILTAGLQTAMVQLQRRIELHRQALYEMYVTHTWSSKKEGTMTPLNMSSLLTNLEGSKSREIFDPLELLYIRLHSAYPTFGTLMNFNASSVNNMLHDAVAMLPSLTPLSPSPGGCRPLCRDGESSSSSSTDPTALAKTKTVAVPGALQKVPLPSRCALSLDELELIEILVFLLLRKWFCTLRGVPDAVPKMCAKNKARYVSGSELNTSDLSDRCGAVGVRCQICPPSCPEDQSAPIATAAGTVLYLFMETDVILLVEPSSNVLGKGTVTFCLPAYYTEAVIDAKFAFKMTLRCESIAHGARCCVVLAFRDTTTAQTMARHVNMTSQSIRKKMCCDLHALISALPGEEGSL